jgi:colicin import membrane protein
MNGEALSLPPTPSWSRPQRSPWPAVIISLLLHGGAFAAYAMWPTTAKAVINLDQAAIKARLVKLGKPRDENLLPRVPTNAPEKAVLKPNTDAPNPAKPAKNEDVTPTAADILNKLKNGEKDNLKEAIERRLGEPTDEGQLDGDKDGAALDGQMVETYFGRVAAKIQRATQLSTVLSDEERVRLRAVVCFQIGDDGALSEVTLGQSSGSTIYDNDVLAAAKRASPVPAPPPGVRDQARKSNCLNFCPTTCR